jgi:hypothetical protein
MMSLRQLASLALVLGVAACGESNGPDTPFDAAGTSADLASVDAAFASPAFLSFSAISADIDGTIAASVVSLNATRRGMPQVARDNALRFAAMIPGAAGPAASGLSLSSSIPPAVAGKTFVWDESLDEYVESAQSGAPSNGVRFVLYAVSPVTGRPVEPLVALGHADVIDQSGGSTRAARVLVVADGVTYVDYGISGSASSSGGTVTVEGFVTDGSVRANFNLENEIRLTSGGLGANLDYDLDVPARDVEIDFQVDLEGTDTGASIDLNLRMNGPNGTVTVEGSATDGGGTFTVEANGSTFATMTIAADDGEPVITGADGVALTDAEVAALTDVFEMYADAFEVFGELMDPVDSLLNGE